MASFHQYLRLLMPLEKGSPISFTAVSICALDGFHHGLHLQDGTWDTVKGSFTTVSDFTDVCYHSYISIMDDLQKQVPPDARYYEIRLLYLPGAVIAALVGLLVDFPMVTLIALCKSPYMLFKGWHRLFHDLIGREGPFLETICVPFAGLAIIFWPLAVVGAVLGSMASSIFLGAYAGVIVYQESSFWFGLCYVVTSLAIYDEYSNDVLDMPEGSCFPRLKYRKKDDLTKAASFSRHGSLRKPPSRSASFNKPMIDLKPFEVYYILFVWTYYILFVRTCFAHECILTVVYRERYGFNQSSDF
uniref:Putative membrane protein At3g27390 isoform X1 n=1 Tax=Rhizophora mucronata TaxID=61149 RepID=A0A2P2KJN8_RHIMU